MKAFLLLGAVVLLQLQIAMAQSPGWEPPLDIHNLSGDSEIRDIATDNAGNVYVTGGFTGTLQLDTVQLTSTGTDWHLFIAKFNHSRKVIWAKAGSRSYSFGGGIAADSRGNVYVGGEFDGRMLVDNDSTTAQSGVDIFLLKLSAAGDRQWLRSFGSAGGRDGLSYNGTCLTVGSDNGIFLTAYFGPASGPHTDSINFDGHKLITTTGGNTFLTRCDSNGQALWAKALLGQHGCWPLGISANSSDQVAITGAFRGPLMLFDGMPFQVPDSAATDCYIANFTANGALGWAHAFGRKGTSDQAISCAVDDQGNVYGVGKVSGDSISFPLGPTISNSGGFSQISNSYIVKYGPSGNYVWGQSFGYTGYTFPHSIKVNHTGGLAVCGEFTVPCYFQGLVSPIAAIGAENAFVTRFDTNGLYKWTRVAGSSKAITMHGLALRDDGSGVTGGTFQSCSTQFGSHIICPGGTYGAFTAQFSKALEVDPSPSSPQAISVFPNPAHSVLQFTVPVAGPLKYRLMNGVGQSVLSGTSVPNGNLHSIPVANIAPGAYLLSIVGSTGSRSQPVIIR